MSKILGTHVTIVPTALGGMTVTTEYIHEYDVEDIVRTRAESQARVVQMVNRGRDIKIKTLDNRTVPTVFTSITEDL